MKKCTLPAVSFWLLLLLLLSLWTCPAGAVDATTFLEQDKAPKLSASAAILVDATYHTILYEKDAYERRYPASITKVMTALLTIEAIERGEISEDTVITASQSAWSDMTADSSTQNVRPGEQMTVKNLLYCLLCASANETGNILAEAVSGNVPAFVERMNVRAQELGMTGTHFCNPHGLHRKDHYSTAYDLWLLCREAMEHPLFREIVSTATYTVPATNQKGARQLVNTNALLTDGKARGYTYKPTIGIKTGSTPEAGYCLASAAQQEGRTLIAIVLQSDNPVIVQFAESQTTDATIIVERAEETVVERNQFVDSRKLLEWGFEAYAVRTILTEDALDSLPVDRADKGAMVSVRPAQTIEALLPLDLNLTAFEVTRALPETVPGPVSEGQVLGQVTVSLDGTPFETVDLVAVNAVELSDIWAVVVAVEDFFSSPLGWMATAGAGILLLALLGLVIWRKHRYHGRHAA